MIREEVLLDGDDLCYIVPLFPMIWRIATFDTGSIVYEEGKKTLSI